MRTSPAMFYLDIAQYADYQYTCQTVLPAAEEIPVKDNNDMPGHLARRFQQIAVAVFLAEVSDAGFDLTPVQYAALATIKSNPGLDQVTLAGLIAYDRTTITGVIDRLVQKGLAERRASSRDRRARELELTDEGKRILRRITPAVEAAQRILLRGLSAKEGEELMRLLRKAIAAGNELSRARSARHRRSRSPRNPGPVRNYRSAVKPGTNLRLLPSATLGA
ncbi:MarR family winged helix-turn-helix transcriptional regulator [Bradyrhizobium sp. RDM4]|uniref:MarR family winged helix-turn-helix transcriptional regulator n=1 Tax=Bradyrhizobium sp. RDM4 TaxID=3378765 RepID=UPI0038FBEF16